MENKNNQNIKDILNTNLTFYQPWEAKKLEFSKTYYVDCCNPNSDDNGAGSKEQPFKTINKAAMVLSAGERVVIASGVYRESIHPVCGGDSCDKMISYEAAEGAEVIVKGSVIAKDGWKVSTGWKLKPESMSDEANPVVWEFCMSELDFKGYNPFALINIIQDRHCFDIKKVEAPPLLKRRGLLFVDGKPLEQVDNSFELGEKDGRFWVDHNGVKLHVRLPEDRSPDKHCIEITIKEHVFRPSERYLGYIRIKGLTFEHAASGFPVPQRGLISANRGHHFILEDNTIQWANSVGVDLGNECWNANYPDEEKGEYIGNHIIRNNTIRQCGICGIAAVRAPNFLIEDNMVEHCGWQNAENCYESAAIKLHHAENLLMRRNVIRHTKHASGVWLDYDNKNCRVTGNVFADIATIAAAIEIEASHEQNVVDNNIIYGVKARKWPEGVYDVSGIGIEPMGTDKLIMAHNLIMNCEMCGIHSAQVNKRIVEGRGGTARKQLVLNNIIHNCGTTAGEFSNKHKSAALEFSNQYNYADGNVYSKVPGGYIKIIFPEPELFLDIDSCREFFSWESNGLRLDMDVDFDVENLTLSIRYNGKLPELESILGLEYDFKGEKFGDLCTAGPFAELLKGSIKCCVDPRRK